MSYAFNKENWADKPVKVACTEYFPVTHTTLRRFFNLPLGDGKLIGASLKDLSSEMSAQAGREVNFMIYDSMATATGRAPSAALPK